MSDNSFTLRKKFIKQLLSKQLTVAFAESMTCGLAIHQLAKVKGTKDVLQGGIVCYHEKVKTGLLGIPKKVIERHTAESREVTKRLAKAIRKLIKADIHGAITGLAAPGGSETKQKPVGTVFITVIYKKRSFQRRCLFRGAPQEIMQKACDEMYRFILQVVN